MDNDSDKPERVCLRMILNSPASSSDAAAFSAGLLMSGFNAHAELSTDGLTLTIYTQDDNPITLAMIADSFGSGEFQRRIQERFGRAQNPVTTD